jgi:hypothetical protein
LRQFLIGSNLGYCLIDCQVILKYWYSIIELKNRWICNRLKGISKK